MARRSAAPPMSFVLSARAVQPDRRQASVRIALLRRSTTSTRNAGVIIPDRRRSPEGERPVPLRAIAATSIPGRKAPRTSSTPGGDGAAVISGFAMDR